MGDNVVSKLAGYILTILVICVIAPYLVLSQMDVTKETYIYSQATEFVDTCRSTGQISPEEYEKYLQKIYSLGNYSIQLEHRSEKCYYRENGETEISSESYFMTQIADDIYKDPTAPAPYKMKNGDRLIITVNKTDRSLSEAIMGFFGIETYKELIVNYGGTVGSTGVD